MVQKEKVEKISTNEKFKLLSGLPIKFKDYTITCPKLIEIADIGLSKYQTSLYLLISEVEDLVTEDGIEKIKKIGIDKYEFICYSCAKDESFRELYLDAFEFFTKQRPKIFRHKDGAFFYLDNFEDNKFISKEDFDRIIDIIKIQNCIKDDDTEDQYNTNPQSEKAKQILEKLKKGKQKVKEIKNKNAPTFPDIVSSFAAKMQMNINDVLNLDFYQFNEQFNRLQKVEDYHISINSIMHGADSKKVKITHYTENTEK